MTRTPSKNIPLARLRSIQADNGIAASGAEYAPDELDTRIMELGQAKADFDFAAVSVRRAVLDRRRRQKRQSTRMRKVYCPDCKYVARVTRTWLDAKGAPICPCSMVPMEVIP